MAEGAAYPAELVNANGQVTAGDVIQFLDATDQPSTGPPFVVGGADLLDLVEDGDAHPYISVGGEVPAVLLSAADGSQGLLVNAAGIWLGTTGSDLLGFYGQAPIAKPSVSDASAAAIIVALAALGLITDDT